ncbi:hypothetical protein Pelo_19587 [Pelomyxa schiedti]|nr:hypothetical protein Pelo_19587 [Pelomyxa schiedti]
MTDSLWSNLKYWYGDEASVTGGLVVVDCCCRDYEDAAAPGGGGGATICGVRKGCGPLREMEEFVEESSDYGGDYFGQREAAILAMSLSFHADKLIGWTSDTSAFVTGFISSIVEAASSSGRSRKIYFANGFENSNEKMSHSLYWRKGCTYPIDITEMDPSTARRMCSLLTTTNKTDPNNEAWDTISATALRTWIP